jgi:hypothetical protein
VGAADLWWFTLEVFHKDLAVFYSLIGFDGSVLLVVASLNTLLIL